MEFVKTADKGKNPFYVKKKYGNNIKDRIPGTKRFLRSPHQPLWTCLIPKKICSIALFYYKQSIKQIIEKLNVLKGN